MTSNDGLGCYFMPEKWDDNWNFVKFGFYRLLLFSCSSLSSRVFTMQVSCFYDTFHTLFLETAVDWFSCSFLHFLSLWLPPSDWLFFSVIEIQIGSSLFTVTFTFYFDADISSNFHVDCFFSTSHCLLFLPFFFHWFFCSIIVDQFSCSCLRFLSPWLFLNDWIHFLG